MVDVDTQCVIVLNTFWVGLLYLYDVFLFSKGSLCVARPELASVKVSSLNVITLSEDFIVFGLTTPLHLYFVRWYAKSLHVISSLLILVSPPYYKNKIKTEIYHLLHWNANWNACLCDMWKLVVLRSHRNMILTVSLDAYCIWECFLVVWELVHFKVSLYSCFL